MAVKDRRVQLRATRDPLPGHRGAVEQEGGPRWVFTAARVVCAWLLFHWGGGGGEGLREVPTACACVCTQPVRVSALLHLRGRNCPNLSKEVLLKLQKF